MKSILFLTVWLLATAGSAMAQIQPFAAFNARNPTYWTTAVSVPAYLGNPPKGIGIRLNTATGQLYELFSFGYSVSGQTAFALNSTSLIAPNDVAIPGRFAMTWSGPDQYTAPSTTNPDPVYATWFLSDQKTGATWAVVIDVSGGGFFRAIPIPAGN
jgi:hypothetical protein